MASESYRNCLRPRWKSLAPSFHLLSHACHDNKWQLWFFQIYIFYVIHVAAYTKLDHCFTGSLLNLAKHPSSTVQILGAEKALFRLVMSTGEQWGILCGIKGCLSNRMWFLKSWVLKGYMICKGNNMTLSAHLSKENFYLLALNTLKSVCIFSILFSIHFQKADKENLFNNQELLLLVINSLFSWLSCLIQGLYTKEKLDASHS